MDTARPISKFSLSYTAGILMKMFGQYWAPHILEALQTSPVPVAADLTTAKGYLCTAVQHCDPNGGPLRVSGTVRGIICKAIEAAPTEEALAAEILAIEAFCERYIPAPYNSEAPAEPAQSPQ